MPARIVLSCLLIAAAACATSGTSTATTGSAAATPAARHDPDVITREDLADASARGLTVYEAIRTLRPMFFSSRGAQSFGSTGAGAPTAADPELGRPHASIDYNGVVALDDLKRLQASTAIEIRLLSASSAIQRFGPGAHGGPVIVVRTM